MDQNQTANNLEAPEEEITGQGEETGEEEAEELEQPDETAQDDSEGESKGIPDDPKLLRKKLTQETQEFREKERAFEDYKSKMDKLIAHPKFKSIYDEVTGTPPQQSQPQAQEPELDLAAMNDQQKEVYKAVKPYIRAALKELGITPKLEQIEKFTMTSAEREKIAAAETAYAKFEAAHPEIKSPEVNKAVADIITSRLNAGIRIPLEDAWSIYKSVNAEKNAKNKITKEMQYKKEADLLKPTGETPPTPITNKKVSAKQAVEMALGDLNY
jgi:hypothetical protein